jgi:hypothetical protein
VDELWLLHRGRIRLLSLARLKLGVLSWMQVASIKALLRQVGSIKALLRQVGSIKALFRLY